MDSSSTHPDLDAEVTDPADFISEELTELWTLDKKREMQILELLAFTGQEWKKELNAVSCLPLMINSA